MREKHYTVRCDEHMFVPERGTYCQTRRRYVLKRGSVRVAVVAETGGLYRYYVKGKVVNPEQGLPYLPRPKLTAYWDTLMFLMLRDSFGEATALKWHEFVSFSYMDYRDGDVYRFSTSQLWLLVLETNSRSLAAVARMQTGHA